MRTIEAVQISAEALAGFLGMNVHTLLGWFQRDGLLSHRAPGRGVEWRIGFEDAIRVYVAKVLNGIGAPTGASARFANGCDAIGAFMAGQPLMVPFRDGAAVLIEPDPAHDARFVLPLEDFGRELADWMAHFAAASLDPAIGGYGGPGAYQAVLTDFEARIAEARRQ